MKKVKKEKEQEKAVKKEGIMMGYIFKPKTSHFIGVKIWAKGDEPARYGFVNKGGLEDVVSGLRQYVNIYPKGFKFYRLRKADPLFARRMRETKKKLMKLTLLYSRGDIDTATFVKQENVLRKRIKRLNEFRWAG